jgi:hypothetical protein
MVSYNFGSHQPIYLRFLSDNSLKSRIISREFQNRILKIEWRLVSSKILLVHDLYIMQKIIYKKKLLKGDPRCLHFFARTILC